MDDPDLCIGDVNSVENLIEIGFVGDLDQQAAVKVEVKESVFSGEVE